MYMTEQRSHFIGIGGIGMSGIARYLLAQGVPVSGSDSRESPTVISLRKLGAEIFIGHKAENVHGASEVITSSAIRPENPEVVEAKQLEIPIVHRSRKLAQLVNDHRGITIAGTHGKTTTSSMVATMLKHAGLAPSYVIGGIVNTFADNASRGDTEWFVIEADESDGSLIEYRPEVAVLTNIEMDHQDYYRDTVHLHEIFAEHVQNVKPGGLVVYCSDDPGVLRLVGHAVGADRLFLSYGLREGADIRAENLTFEGLGSSFDVITSQGSLGRVALQVPGRHNVQNSLAAVTIGLHLGLDIETIAAGLWEFMGVQRRFQIMSRTDQCTVVDDYAHHPSEIVATLSAARQSHKDRIVTIFQPHRYSRTKSLARDFGAAFANADEVIVVDIYGAGEEPIPQVSSELIVRSLLDHNHPCAQYLPELQAAEDYVAEHLQPNDLVITLGAGDVYKIAQNLSKGITPEPVA
jgi:UDP-N-acetylmuramate--alanine ligase